MRVSTYICRYCMYMCVCTYVCMYCMNMCVCTYIRMYCMYMCVCTYVCTVCTCVYACMYVRTYLCTYCTCVNMFHVENVECDPCVNASVLEFHSGQNVSVNNWLLHESRCARINTVCPKCKEPVLKANLEEHEEEYHAIEICDLCRKRVEKWLMDKHKVCGNLYSYAYVCTLIPACR